MGDGSLHVGKKNSTQLSFATNGFKVEEIEGILIPKLLDMGIESKINKSSLSIHNEQQYVLRLSNKSIKKFFEVVGEYCPVRGYEYKFQCPKFHRYYRIGDVINCSGVDKNDNSIRGAINYMISKGEIVCIRDDARRILFNKSQFKNAVTQVRKRFII